LSAIGIQVTRRDLPALPDPAQRLLLRTALLDGDACRAAWSAWRHGGGHIDDVDTPTFRLLPLIYRNLERNRVDDPDLLRLKGAYRHAWVTNQRLFHRAGGGLEALDRCGIPTMVLKGAAVATTHYEDMGARAMDDVDVLVPTDAAELALDALRADGWSPQVRIDPVRVIRSFHAMPLADASGAKIDLHWRALPESVTDDDFWDGAVPVTVGRATTLAPGATEQLLHTCAHGLRVYGAPLRWVADAAVILGTADIDWRRLIDGVVQRQIALKTVASLATLVDVLEAPIPSWVISTLRAVPTSRQEELLLGLALRPRPIGGYVQIWDMYRRRVSAGDYEPAVADFLQYVADASQLPSRRAIGPRLVRRALWLVAQAGRSLPSSRALRSSLDQRGELVERHPRPGIVVRR
jgi:hypothetical protein